MDILKDIIGDKGTEILAALTQQGFSTDNAQSFISESGDSIMSALNSGNVDLTQGDVQQKTDSIISNIDIASLASKVGINSEMAQQGLGTVVPLIMNAVQDKLGDASGLMSLLGNSDAGAGLMGNIKKLF